MSARSKTKNKSEPNPKPVKQPPKNPSTAGPSKEKSLSNLYAQLALAPENKKYLIQKIIDLVESRK